MKKTTTLLFSLLLGAAPLVAQVNEKLTPEDLTLIESPKSQSPVVLNEDAVTIYFDEVRALTEINVEDKADAYPWISADGLRLYFTQEVNSSDMLFYTSRPNLRAPFGPKKPVPIELEGSMFSAWYTANELEVYFVYRGENDGLYHGTRTAIDQPFSVIHKVELEGLESASSVNGPSLTPDGKYLMLRFVAGDGSYTLLERTGENSFRFVETITTDFQNSPGQLSKDGEKIFIPCDDQSDEKSAFSFCLMEKDENTQRFEKPTYVRIKTPGVNLLSITQPTVSGNEKVMIFVGGNSGNWNDNDLYIATNFSELEDVVADARDSKNFFLSGVTPNPAKNFATVNYLLPKKEASESYISILNTQGQEVRRFAVTGHEGSLRMDITGLAEGVYVCKLITPLRFSESQRLIVR